jgi:hypothetical protein
MLHQEQAYEAQDKVGESVLDLGVVQVNPLAALTSLRTRNDSSSIYLSFDVLSCDVPKISD